MTDKFTSRRLGRDESSFHDVAPPQATPEQLTQLSRNLEFVCAWNHLNHHSILVAAQSAQLDRDKAARCYAAIATSIEKEINARGN